MGGSFHDHDVPATSPHPINESFATPICAQHHPPAPRTAPTVFFCPHMSEGFKNTPDDVSG